MQRRSILSRLRSRIEKLEQSIPYEETCWVAVQNEDGSLRPLHPGKKLHSHVIVVPTDHIMSPEEWERTYCNGEAPA
jgi:hypothetical protein